MIRPFDPLQPRSRGYRAYERFARTRFGRWLGINLAARVDPWLLTRTRGRVAIFFPAPHVLLAVPGRRSGQMRETPLLYFTDGEDVILIASSFGRDRHPAWYLNAKAHPEVTLTARGRSARYVAEEVADGAERRRLLDLARGLYRGYGDYEARTDRRIPVMRLRRATR